MSHQALDTLAALTSGSDLWVIPDPENSKWARRIDWYLNFQVVRAKPHALPKVSEPLKNILAQSELDAPEITVSPAAPLLVASEDLLPNRITVVVPLGSAESRQKEWVRRCHALWRDLGKPSARVFLPGEITPDAFTKAWPKEDSSASVQLVAETELDLLRP